MRAEAGSRVVGVRWERAGVMHLVCRSAPPRALLGSETAVRQWRYQGGELRREVWEGEINWGSANTV